jgi:hypothetical protein
MLQVGTVHKDMKDVKKEAGEIRKIAMEAWTANERLKASYVRIGKILENYYEIK